MSELVFYVNQTAHAICRLSFRQSLDSFCFLLFVFRFSLFDHRSVSCCNCYLPTWIRECLSERVSELENEWMFYVNQTVHAICRDSFRQSLDSFCFLLFVFRFSFFAFRFTHSLTHVLRHLTVKAWSRPIIKKRKAKNEKRKAKKQKESFLWPNERLHVAWAVWWT